MVYHVLWREEAVQDLQALPRHEAKRIKKKVDGYLAQDPVRLGKPLSGDLSGLFRYRIGDVYE